MNFVFVVPNLAGGGAEKAILKLSRILLARGHRVDLLLLEKRLDHIGADGPVEGLTLHCLADKAPHGWLGKRLLAAKLKRRLANLGAVPDLVVSTLPFADEIAALARLPRHWCRIANTLGSEIAQLATHQPAKARRRRQRYQKIYGSRGLIAVSAGVGADLRASLGISSRIEVIGNAFDFAAMRMAAKRVAQAAAPELPAPTQPYVLHVGRFAAQKRHDLLLDAWAQLATERQLVLLTEPHPALQALIDQRGLTGRVRIAGFQTNPYPWLAGADLLVLCSDHEGLPNVLIEALVCGTPVISTDCPSGPSEILADLPDCLVPCGDADALAAAIDRVLAQPPDISRVDLRAYDQNTVAEAYERLAAEKR